MKCRLARAISNILFIIRFSLQTDWLRPFERIFFTLYYVMSISWIGPIPNPLIYYPLPCELTGFTKRSENPVQWFVRKYGFS